MALDITAFGASTGATDNTSAIQNALNAAASQGTSVFVPLGSFKYANVLTIPGGVTIAGTGWGSILQSTNTNLSALQITGSGAGINNLWIQGTNAGRLSAYETCGITARSASNFIIDRVQISNVGGACMHITGCNNGLVTNNYVHGSQADSIHHSNFEGGCTNMEVAYNRIEDSGDDGVAVVSYAGNSLHNGFLIHHNACTHQLGGRGYSVVGGQNVQIYDNYYNQNVAGFAGIYIAAESSFNSLGVDSVQIRRNVIVAAGPNHGAIHVFVDSQPITNVTVDSNRMYNSGSFDFVINGTNTSSGNDLTNNIAYGGPGTFASLQNGQTLRTNTNNVINAAVTVPTGIHTIKGTPTVNEGQTMTFTMERTPTNTAENATIGTSGTATPTQDYTPPSTSFTWGQYEHTKTLSIVTLADVNLESTETVIVNITAGTGNTIPGIAPSNSATGNILNVVTVVVSGRSVNVGTSANDGTGDTIRAAFQVCNTVFREAYNGIKIRPARTGSGRYYPPIYAVSTGLAAVAANIMYFMPHLMGWAGTINDVALQVTTLVAGTHCKVAIYGDNGGVPGIRLADLSTTAVLDCGSTGVKSCTAAGNVVSLAVNAGDLIWVGTVFDGAPTLTILPNTTLMPMFPWDASFNKMNRLSASGSTYATGLPSDAGTLSGTLGYFSSNSNPLSCLQFA